MKRKPSLLFPQKIRRRLKIFPSADFRSIIQSVTVCLLWECVSWCFCTAYMTWELVMNLQHLEARNFCKTTVYIFFHILWASVCGPLSRRGGKMVINDLWSELLIFALQFCGLKLLIFTVVGGICEEFPVCSEHWRYDCYKNVKCIDLPILSAVMSSELVSCAAWGAGRGAGSFFSYTAFFW